MKDIKSSVLYGTPGQGTRHHKLTRIKTQEEGVFVTLGGRRLEVMARMFFSCLDGTFFSDFVNDRTDGDSYWWGIWITCLSSHTHTFEL